MRNFVQTILIRLFYWLQSTSYRICRILTSIHVISLLSCLATFATVVLLREQIMQQKEFLDITQRAQFQIIIRDPCRSDPLKLAALDALIKIDRDYNRHPDLRWAQLSELDLSGMDLTKVNLQFSNLQGATLVNINFTEADLSDADLSGANLSGSSIDDVIFKNARYIKGSTIFPKGFNRQDEMNSSDELHQKKDCNK